MNDCQYCQDNPTFGPVGEKCVLCGQPFVALRETLADDDDEEAKR